MPLAAADHESSVIIDDIRQTSLSQIMKQALIRWSTKPDQGGFASKGMLDLGHALMSRKLKGQSYGNSSSSQLQSTLIHVATNSIHFFLRNDPILHAAPRRRSQNADQKLDQLQCSSCQATMTILHFTTCPSSTSVFSRQRMRDSIFHLLTESADTNDWLTANHLCDLSSLLHRLFPPPVSASASPEELTLHTARCLIGAFTQRELRAASKILDFQQPQDGESLLGRLRLCCLDNIQSFYSELKVNV